MRHSRKQLIVPKKISGGLLAAPSAWTLVFAGLLWELRKFVLSRGSQ
jgi:hypothetical protein